MVSGCTLYPQEPPAKILKTIQQTLENNSFQIEDAFDITDTLKKLCAKSKKIFATIKNPFQKSHAEEIFEKSLSTISTLETLEKTRIEEDLHLVEEIQNISKDLDKLELEFVLLEPEEIQEKISSLSKTLTQVTQKKSYNKNFLDRAIYQCFEKLDSIKFRLNYPIMEELSEYSYQQTFARTLKSLASEFLQNKNFSSSTIASSRNSFTPSTLSIAPTTPLGISFLSKHQKRQIFDVLLQIKNLKRPSSESFDSLWKKSSNEEKGKAIFSFLHKIQHLADLAKALAYENIELFFSILERLDEKILADVQKMLFELQVPLADWQKSLKENDPIAKSHVVEALMKLVERAILT
jgi:hypothetical protein